MQDVTRGGRCERCGAAMPAGGSSRRLCDRCAIDAGDAPTMIEGRAPGDAPTQSGRPPTADEAPTQSSRALAGGDDEAPTVATVSPMVTPSRVDHGDAETVLSRMARSRPRGAPLLSPGEVFGSYRIEQLLGRGGMGEVYAAEHLDHGRRVALKVVTAGFAGPEDRARFLREGELAASINHPHTVYVYGSEDIEGAPVITMELLTGGTLRDVVQARGPLPTREAVDRILDVVAGLEAAERAGILHRDIKPANCFIDANRVVKVGDFGLSIGTAGERAATGTFQGTPQFAPPEQLRGDALDVRADIYAVGATLFYLLTGQPPFDDQDLTTLITRVKAEMPRSAREMRAGVPDALAALVSRCLSKERDQRPASYHDLEDELRPFSSAAPQPAPLGRRAAAGLVDHLAFSFLVVPLIVVMMMRGQFLMLQVAFAQVLSIIVYFTVLEGVWGASIGKRLFGLRVARLDGQRPGMGRAFGRALMYQTNALVSVVPTMVVGSARMTEWTTREPWAGPLIGVGAYAILALLFSTARRRNGFAAMHDLATGTRVVLRRARVATSPVDLGVAPGTQRLADVAQIGPYEVIGALGFTATGDVLLGRDERLKRSVWIHRQPPGTPAVPVAWHTLGRPGRLRWLNGRRTASEAWDAYEASDGAPLVLLERPQPWSVVRRWVHDLATEIHAGAADGTITNLSNDRVWLTAAHGAKLLDFRAPRIPEHIPQSGDVPVSGAQPWLANVARRALAGVASAEQPSPDSGSAATLGERSTPPPPTATSLLDRLTAGTFASLGDVVATTGELLHRLPAVTRKRRSATALLAALTPAAFALAGLLAGLGLRQLATSTPDLEPATLGLRWLAPAPGDPRPDPPLGDEERRALEVYLVGRYRATLAADSTWTHPLNAARLVMYRDAARDLLARHPSATPDDAQRARAVIGRFIQAEDAAIRRQQRRAASAVVAGPIALTWIGLGTAAAFGLVFAFVFRGGLLFKFFGLAVVDVGGRRVARWRALARAVTAWAPSIALCVLGLNVPVFIPTASTPAHPGWTALAVALVVLALAGAAIALWSPTRGLQDRIAGTYVVPE